MRIEEDKKLDYSNVLLRPKRSTLISRKDVDVDRHFTFRNGKTFFNIPIMAANMDGVGTFEMAKKNGTHFVFRKGYHSYGRGRGYTIYRDEKGIAHKVPLDPKDPGGEHE